jgi:peptidoglycan/xylan/chitin deacetylase (PgdA/CDA1 family)
VDLVRRNLKHVYFTLLQLLGEERRRLRWIGHRDLLVLLCLHRVSPHPNPFWDPLSPRLLDDLLVFLKRRFQVTTLGSLAFADPAWPVAILSFDDGYGDFVEYAMPLLEKHCIQAHLNITPACVRGGSLWEVRLADFLNSAPRQLIREIRLPGFDHHLNGSDPHAKMRYGLALTRYLKLRPRSERSILWQRLEALVAKASDVAWTRMMNLREVKEAARVHEVGGHSFFHESMDLETEAFFRVDLERCIAFFRDELELPMRVYAFPSGAYTSQQIEILFQNGVQHVMLCGDEYATRGGRVYPRFVIHGDSSREVCLRALGCTPGRGWARAGSVDAAQGNPAWDFASKLRTFTMAAAAARTPRPRQNGRPV